MNLVTTSDFRRCNAYSQPRANRVGTGFKPAPTTPPLRSPRLKNRSGSRIIPARFAFVELDGCEKLSGVGAHCGSTMEALFANYQIHL